MGESASKSIHLNTLREGAPGLTSAVGSSLAEAAAVSLEDQKHASGVAMRVTGDASETFAVEWDPATDQMRRTWADEQVASEHGAYGCAMLVIEQLTGLQVVQRSRKGTGFDWWLGTRHGPKLFQEKARLEVSGIRKGGESDVAARTSQKVKQTKQSDATRLPAWAVVVEFSEPQTRAVERCKT